MDHETSPEAYRNRLPQVIDYLRDNPTPDGFAADGRAIHLHEHHHYAAPAPPPPPPKATVAEQLIPWVYLLVLVMIAATVCAAILAVIGIILIIVLLAVAVVIGMLTYLVRSMAEGTAVKALADQGKRNK